MLKKTIIKYIDSIKTIDTIFQKMGFVEVELLKYNNLNPQKSDLQYIYRISDQGFLHKYDIKSSYLPHSYTYLSGKLVLFFNETFNFCNIKRDKNYILEIEKHVKPYLGKVEHLYHKDSITGKVIFDDKEFRPDTYIKLHHGFLLKIYHDGSYKIEDFNYND